MPAAAAPEVALFTDPRMGRHHPPGHPERAERLEAAARGVADGARQAGAALASQDVTPAGDATLQRLHPAEYLAVLDAAAARGGGWIDADTYLGPGSMDAARLAAGATVDAARMVARSEARVAFAVVRPPGHHARAGRPAGFCLFNNFAIAALALRAEGHARRIAIVDWDVHHGDGTQAIFDADPDLCYASTHQMPLYPGSGSSADRGLGPAYGTKHNAPLAPGAGDEAFVAAWESVLLPALRDFGPHAILVSAGYDGHRDDPLAALEVSEDGYRRVAVALGSLAADLGMPGVALTLEGGYDLDALRASTAATVAGLLAGMAGTSTL